MVLAQADFIVLSVAEIVPISAPGQNSRNEKNIRTSITDRSLHHLSKSVTRRVQEEVLAIKNPIHLRNGKVFKARRLWAIACLPRPRGFAVGAFGDERLFFELLPWLASPVDSLSLKVLVDCLLDD